MERELLLLNYFIKYLFDTLYRMYKILAWTDKNQTGAHRCLATPK